MAESTPLISLNPPEILTFQLEPATSPQMTLKIRNDSDEFVIFKVKTTQPDWYFVRPNQNVIQPGATEEVVIVLAESECNRFISLSARGHPEPLDKHRFLVQNKIVYEDDYSRLSSLPVASKADEYASLWGRNPADERKSIKLKVEYIYPSIEDDDEGYINSNTSDSSAGAPSSSKNRTASVSESVEDVRNRLGGGRDRSSDETAANSKKNNKNNPEAIVAELQTLRKKYDDVIGYTVHLTAERDSIINQLDEAKRESQRLKQQMNRSNINGSNVDGKVEGKKVQKQGVSYVVLLAMCIFWFFLGRYIFPNRK